MTQTSFEDHLAEAIRARAENEPVQPVDVADVISRPLLTASAPTNKGRILTIAAMVAVLLGGGALLRQQNGQEVGTATTPAATTTTIAAETTDRLPADSGREIAGDELNELRAQLFGNRGDSAWSLWFSTNPDEQESLHTQHEQALTNCMNEQGFEYEALPYTGSVASRLFDTPLAPQEFVEQYGLGISTLWEAEELDSAISAATSVNPNDAIIATLTESQLAAYNQAMSGPSLQLQTSEDGSFQPADPRTGCGSQAAKVYGGFESLDLPDEARTELRNLEASVVQTDPRVVEARKNWRACMTTAGYDASGQDPLQSLVTHWLSPLLTTPATKTVTTESHDGTPITVEVPDIDNSALANVQQREIQLALANQTCDNETGLSHATNSARIDAQTQAITKWHNELTAQN